MTTATAGNTRTKPAGAAAPGQRISVYPSSTVRPVPGFLFEDPDGFELDEAPGALAVARTVQEVDGFWVNVIISADRVPAGLQLQQAAQQTFAQLQRQCPGLKVNDEKVGRFGDRITHLRAVEVAAPQSNRKLTQVHALFFAPQPEAAKTTDLFHIVGTCPSEQANVFAPVFVKLISSFRFT
jgi:hypothetical protein